YSDTVGGTWIHPFTGAFGSSGITDGVYTDAVINYYGQIQALMRSLSSPRLMSLNTYPTVIWRDSARRAAALNNIDVFVEEGGFFGPEQPGNNPSYQPWLDHGKFIAAVDAVSNKGVYSKQLYHAGFNPATNPPGKTPGLPYPQSIIFESEIPQNYIRFSLA